MSWLIPSLPSWASNPVPVIKDEEVTEDGSQEVSNAVAGPSKPTLSVPSMPPPPPPPQIQLISPPSPTGSTSSSRTASPPRRKVPSSSGPSINLPAPIANTKTTSQSSLPSGGMTETLPPKKRRAKVALAPGCSPLDWARLQSSGDEDLRGGYGQQFPMRITLSELAKHKSKDDAWSAFNGRVYNITPYLRFHPGGERELMRAAGRDGTKLFMEYHAWVSPEQMLNNCLIGMLVPG